MKKIVSFCLYGCEKQYTVNALVNLELCQKFYPDWDVFFYHDDTVPTNVLREMKRFPNCTLMQRKGFGHDRMWWRFLSYDHSDLFISRDADSHITKREVSAVEDWLNTEKNLHVMRDYGLHNNRVQGGMFGMRKNNKIPSMELLLEKEINRPRNYYEDEYFLSNKIYPLFRGDMVVHDSYNRDWGCDRTHRWRIALPDGDFVGSKKDCMWGLAEKYCERLKRQIKFL